MAEMCKPDRIYWCDGSDSEKEQLRAQAVSTGELIVLNQSKLPGCVLHRTAENDVARTEQLTFICTSRKEDAGPNNNWMPPEEAYRRGREIFSESMKGRTMYVVAFSMGPIGSEFSKVGVELTDSIYVVENMRIMTRMGSKVLNYLDSDREYTKCLHSKADLDINNRLILHFPEENTIWSVGSGYGGNVLLGKKCLALRMASYAARQQGWLAEHMLIMGVEEPNGRIEYLAAAFPSACGKTNLAMLVPPRGLQQKGYRIWTVGDDIAWMRIDTDGRLWGMNPEIGLFGVAPGTNSMTNPNAMTAIRKNTIYTNTILTPDRSVWWEGGDDPSPSEGLDWRGRPWNPTMKDENGNPVLGAHPNSRFTVPIKQVPSVSFRLDQHHGVPISAIVFGGRRAHLAPLVYQAFSWQHGVYVGAITASEVTAAQYGNQGQLRRDPMAMLPFCGYNMADYFAHWLRMGARMLERPAIFHVNWFRQDQNGHYLWPGFGENLRIIEWILARSRGEAEAVTTPIGHIPHKSSLDLTGLEISDHDMEALLKVDRSAWLEDVANQRNFFQQFGDRLPREIYTEMDALEYRLTHF
jgi:phosphoenolpyruvate carboxykinase (GTP)